MTEYTNFFRILIKNWYIHVKVSILTIWLRSAKIPINGDKVFKYSDCFFTNFNKLFQPRVLRNNEVKQPEVSELVIKVQ